MGQDKPKAVLFDFDGVICQTEVYRMDYRERQLARAGVLVDRRALYTLINQTPAQDRGKRMDALFGDQEAYRLHREELIAFPQLEYRYRELLTPGLPETLMRLREAGLKTGVASNSSGKVLERGLAECGIASLFDVTISGWDLERRKPDPYIYQLAMERLNVSPPECVIVEDSQIGIQAGQAAGAAAVFALRDRDGLLDQQGCRKVLGHISELLPELKIPLRKKEEIHMPGGTPIPNRYIKSDLKSHRILWEAEHPCRWPFMKVLREFSTLKEFYPEIDPYVEAYKVRENVWALFQESMDGVGDLWMYVIDGPERVMVVDTGFGVGDLKGLVQHLVGSRDKEIFVANTHHHYDHAYGNAQFDRCCCHEDEVYSMRLRAMSPRIWDYLFDRDGKNIYTEFDRADIIPYREYELIGVPTGHIFDLGGGYEVEAIPLRGHSAGQCAYLDKHNHILFAGDITGVGGGYEGDPKADNCNVETLWRDMQVVVGRLEEIESIFPGHGCWDVTSSILQYELDALDRIMADPEGNADGVRVVDRGGKEVKMFTMNIHQGTAVRYTLEKVYRKTPYQR